MFPIRLVPAVVVLSVLALPAVAQGPGSTRGATDVEEAPLRLRYLPWVDALMMAIHKDGAFYFPASELLRRVGIVSELRHSEQRLSGFYLRPQTPYLIDLNLRVANVGDRSVEIRDGEALSGELDLFLAAAFFERLFGWRVAVDPRSLEVRIESREPLPIAAAAMRLQRTRGEVLLDTSSAVNFGRERRILYGGALDYSVRAEGSNGGVQRALDVTIGAEVLGGDFQTRFQGGDGLHSGPALHASEFRWRHVVKNSAVLSQVAIGHVSSSGPAPAEIRGLQITNEPLATRAKFATRVLQGTTGAEWDVEVYVNERLVARERADPLGRYRVEVPIGYGSASMRLLYLGPGGETRQETSRIEVPFTFLPPRRIAYVLTVGKDERSENRSAHAEIGVGLSTWLTTRSGVEYRKTGDDDDSPVTYHTISARVGANRILGASLSPGARTRISGAWLFASRAHVAATFARYGTDPRLSQTHVAWEWDGTGSLPFQVTSVPITLRLGGGARADRGGGLTRHADAEAMFGIGPWAPSVGYRSGAANSHGELRATSLLFLGHRLPAPLRHTMLRASVARPVRAGETGGHAEVGALVPLGDRHRLDLGYRYGAELRSSQLEMRLQLETRSGRATTAHRRSGSEAFWSQTVGGSIAIDPHRGRVTLSGRPLVGRGGVSVRFFLDENGNNRFDQTEVRVTGATVRFDRVAELRTSQLGEMIATELLAHHRYHGQVDIRDVPNPLWRPQFTAFSFIADPNRFQAIEVPFYAAATAQGIVTRTGDGADRPVPGLKVHVMSADGSLLEVLSTFADGSFYHQGLPPGRYIVKLDSAQLDILAATSNPSQRAFDLGPSREGASMEGLDFILRPRAWRP